MTLAIQTGRLGTVAVDLDKRCKVRSRAAGQPAPCRESHVSPGTCVWCLERIDSLPALSTRSDGELDWDAFLGEVMRAERVTRAKHEGGE